VPRRVLIGEKKVVSGHPVIAGRADATTVTLELPTHWPSRALAQVLPHGLPVGTLITILLPPQGGIQYGPWSTLVGQLCLDTIDLCRPVVYTYSEAPYVFGPIDGIYDLTDMYLHVLDVPEVDEHGVHAPLYRGVAGRVDGVDSTLGSLRRGLEEHEAQYGPALAVLDGAEGAHPYARATRGAGGGSHEHGAVPSAEAHRSLARSWAAELRDFATARLQAPTVAVWVVDDKDDPGPRALAAASTVVITAAHVPGRREVPVRVHQRPDVTTPWGSPSAASLSRFDWGFKINRAEEAPFERDEVRRPTSDLDWVVDLGGSDGSAPPAPEPTAETAA
jgi:hypothetical protein